MRWFTLILIGCVSVQAAGAVINVPADWPTIQDAIDNSVNGDEIIVAPGTYFESINFNGKIITVRSTDPTDAGLVMQTIIDGPGQHVVVFESGEGPGSVISGFVITGGNAFCDLMKEPFWDCQGGGMLNRGSSPTVTNCSFIGNTAFLEGGGMSNIYNSSPRVINCWFSGNTTSQDGGGMYNNDSSPTVTNCSFSGNTASQDGGGMANFNNSNSTVTNCSFSKNTSGDNGGGMLNVSSNPTVADCSFSVNSAVTGGGMDNTISNPAVTNCSFSGNTTSAEGGGMFNLVSSPIVTNCSFIGNTADINGGGMINNSGSDPTLTDCTFSGNTAVFNGGGIYNDFSLPTLIKTGFCDNTPDQIFGSFTDGGGMSLLYCAPPLPVSDSCPADINTDTQVNVTDLLVLLAAWGACP